MKILPDEMNRWGFSQEDIDFIEKISSERFAHITQYDTKGKMLFSIIEKYSHLTGSFSSIDGKILIDNSSYIDEQLRKELKEDLLKMWPWRKGPLNIFDIEIDAEWRADFKWKRLLPHIKSLRGKHILDIGSNNGYYMFRMSEENPAMVMGVEPYINYYMQFLIMKKFTQIDNIFTLPLKFEDIAHIKKKFNTIFCMGILYHRKSPLDFLKEIHTMMAGDGELVLETLILEGDSHYALVPEGRYSKMPNVYFIPTLPVIFYWLKKTGFVNSRCVDISYTDFNEQKKTPWVNTESLEDFLDPQDRSKTVEGYPAPVRAIIISEKRR